MANLTVDVVQDWLDRYLEAWRTYDARQIGDLFTDDAEYRYHPGDDPLVGRDEIVGSWQSNTDLAGSWEAEYTCWSVSDDQAIATGWTRYSDGSRYWNLFQLVFRDGRCSDFVEWYLSPRDDEED